jgi:hypothetical protein
MQSSRRSQKKPIEDNAQEVTIKGKAQTHLTSN